MNRTVRTFGTRISQEGFASAILAAVEYSSPSPLQERLSLTREFKRQPLDRNAPRFSIWYHGFTPKSFELYDFEAYHPDQYISDLDERYCWQINEPHADLLEDKQRFARTLRDHGHGACLPEQFGRISEDALGGSDVAELLRREGSLVAKAQTGAGGGEVYLCELEGETPRINGERHSWSSFQTWIDALEGYLVTEYCEQAEYVNAIFPDTPNTIRLLTMNPDDRPPFVAAAVHRIGSHTSGAVDNFSRGGLSAEITEEGVLGTVVRYHDGEVTWHETHPDTGSPITGVRIPDWKHTRQTLLSIVDDIPEFRYVGWDVLCTEKGPKILEGNSNTDTDLIQAHGPLLEDERVRAFYREQGIVE